MYNGTILPLPLKKRDLTAPTLSLPLRKTNKSAFQVPATSRKLLIAINKLTQGIAREKEKNPEISASKNPALSLR